MHTKLKCTVKWSARTTRVEEWFPLQRSIIRTPNLDIFLFIRSDRLKTFIEGEHTGQREIEWAPMLLFSGSHLE